MNDQEKITMTDDEFREWHYKLWDWLAETGERNKCNFFKFQELKEIDENLLDRAVLEALDSCCFACCANELENNNNDCKNCPIIWEDGEDNFCFDEGTLFIKWIKCKTIEDRKHYAKLISQLPWRGKEREK